MGRAEILPAKDEQYYLEWVGGYIICGIDDKNKAVVLDPSSADEGALMEAAKSSPRDAIILEPGNLH